MLQNKICCCKKTKTVTESLRSFVAKRNLLLQKHSDALRELTKSCCKKKFAVVKILRCLQIAYEVLLQKQICCWKKTSTVSQTLPSCVGKRNLLLEKNFDAFRELNKCVAKTNLLLQKDGDASRELTKLCSKKKFGFGKKLRPFHRA